MEIDRTHADRSPQLPRWCARAVVTAGALVALIFAAYELVERTWLAGADPALLHDLHIARGVLSSFVVAVAVAVLALKAYPAPFSPHTEGVGDRQALQYARWFTRMRWAAVLVALILTLVATVVTGMLASRLAVPLAAIIGGLAVLNVLYTIWIRRVAVGQAHLAFQVYADLLLLTGLLHFAGGIENPLAVFMGLHVIIAGILLSPVQCYLTATVASGLLAGLALAESSGLLPHYPFSTMASVADRPFSVLSFVGIQAGYCFLAAFFVTSLVGRVRIERQVLEKSLDSTGTALRVLDPHLRPEWASTLWHRWFDGNVGPDAATAGQAVRDGHPHVSEFDDPRGVRSNGWVPRGRIFRIVAAPVQKDGRTDRVAQLVQEVTEQKHAEARMLEASRMAAVGELAGRVAHEMNNPLGVIGGKTKLLLRNHRQRLPAFVVGELGKIAELSDRAAAIATGLLSSSRPSGTARHRIGIADPLEKALSLIEQHARTRRIAIRRRFSAAPAVDANEAELERLFLNLLLNAVDAMGTRGWIGVRLGADRHADGTGARVCITDTGPGVPGEVRSKIFEPFFSTKERGKGTGLGLAICRSIVHSHGGTITVQSRPGRGTRFTIRLPATEPTHA